MTKWRCAYCGDTQKQPAIITAVGHDCPQRASQKPDKRWVDYVRVEEAA